MTSLISCRELRFSAVLTPYSAYKDCFPAELPVGLPPERSVYHAITLKDISAPVPKTRTGAEISFRVTAWYTLRSGGKPTGSSAGKQTTLSGVPLSYLPKQELYILFMTVYSVNKATQHKE